MKRINSNRNPRCHLPWRVSRPCRCSVGTVFALYTRSSLYVWCGILHCSNSDSFSGTGAGSTRCNPARFLKSTNFWPVAICGVCSCNSYHWCLQPEPLAPFTFSKDVPGRNGVIYYYYDSRLEQHARPPRGFLNKRTPLASSR